jgi:hypothetical protein
MDAGTIIDLPFASQYFCFKFFKRCKKKERKKEEEKKQY